MKIANICANDYANLAFENARALNETGIQCIALKTSKHPYNYPQQARVTGKAEIIELCKNVDIIQIFHTDAIILDWVKHLGKRMVVYHTGTRYRQEPEKYNSIFNPVVERVFTDQPEFYTLGGKNITYYAAATDTDKLQYSATSNSKLLFSHYPSKGHVKGSENIVRMMEHLDCDFTWNATMVDYEENLIRMSQCDVYIEMFALTQDGKEYGQFGVTAFEAAALGKIVITNSLNHYVYGKYYGTDELVIANTEVGFTLAVKSLLTKSKEEIESKKQATRNWIIEKHSLKATGNYLLNYLK